MHQVGALLNRVLDGWASPAGETALRRAKQDIPGPAAAISGKAGDSFRRSLPSTAWVTLCPHLLSYQKLQAYQRGHSTD